MKIKLYYIFIVCISLSSCSNTDENKIRTKDETIEKRIIQQNDWSNADSAQKIKWLEEAYDSPDSLKKYVSKDFNEISDLIKSKQLIDNYPEIKFDFQTHNFDTVVVGSTVKHSFKFENLGPGPLQILSVKAACGCTVLKDWPKGLIEKGEKGEIPIEFNPKFSGKTKKYISIIANTKPATKRLYLEGYVLDK